jgi:hypothetical protein
MRKLFLLTLFSVMTQITANAQMIKFEYLGYSGLSDKYAKSGRVGIGYDQNVGTKVSLALTFHYYYDLAANGAESRSLDFNDNEYGHVRMSFDEDADAMSLTYSSKFYFKEVSDRGLYCSAELGIMKTTLYYTPYNISADNRTLTAYKGVQAEVETSISKILIPVSFNLGYRGDIEGGYGEYYFGITTLPLGNGDSSFPSALRDHGFGSRYTKFAFQFGFSAGFGW